MSKYSRYITVTKEVDVELDLHEYREEIIEALGLDNDDDPTPIWREFRDIYQCQGPDALLRHIEDRMHREFGATFSLGV